MRNVTHTLSDAVFGDIAYILPYRDSTGSFIHLETPSRQTDDLHAYATLQVSKGQDQRITEQPYMSASPLTDTGRVARGVCVSVRCEGSRKRAESERGF